MALAQGGGRYQSQDAWTFGVTADTQWTITHSLVWDPDDPYYAHVNPNYREENPNYVSVSTALKLNEQFIDHGVRFVVQLGDLTDRAGDAAMFTHAEARQPLYDAGIGFFPVRGNHETYGSLYGLDPYYTYNIPAWREAFPQTQGEGDNLFEATNFILPDIEGLKGLSYSFDYGAGGNDARFVFVDTENAGWKIDIHDQYGPGYFYFSSNYWWTVYYAGEAQCYMGQQMYASTEYCFDAGDYFRIRSAGQLQRMVNAADLAEPLGPAVSPLVYRPGDQQDWISERLEDIERPAHAFILTHRNLMGQNHRDTAWGDDPAQTPGDQNVFFQSMQSNGVRYFLSAHDHMHNRSIVTSPDGNWFVEQLIASSSDPKFYSPQGGTFSGQRQREIPLSQELNNIGYYIYTVDGSRVNVDYYSDRIGIFGGDYCWPDGYAGEDGTCLDPRSNPPPERMGSFYVPAFDFVKKENWGYGLNGKQFLFPQGTSYAGETLVYGDEIIEIPGVEDAFNGTQAKILYGFNGSVSTDNLPDAPRPLSKTVTTGWVENPNPKILLSHIFSLWGLSELYADGVTDTYVLEMSYGDPRVRGKGKQFGNAGIRLCSLDANGNWVNAVNLNIGKKNARDHKFIKGPWKPQYTELGNYGIDMEKGTVWAVINYAADFAVSGGIGGIPGQSGAAPGQSKKK